MSKILIVEDDLSIQALLHDFIKEAGHNVVLASDGVEALAKYEFLGEERIIDTHIKNLRKKLGTTDYIETIRGVGYRIDKDDQE